MMLFFLVDINVRFQTLLPRSSLLIVDVQNDFIDGTLALKHCPAKQDGADVLPYINKLIDTVPFNVITYSLDWHPKDHCSFIENIKQGKLHPLSPVIKQLYNSTHQ